MSNSHTLSTFTRLEAMENAAVNGTVHGMAITAVLWTVVDRCSSLHAFRKISTRGRHAGHVLAIPQFVSAWELHGSRSEVVDVPTPEACRLPWPMMKPSTLAIILGTPPMRW